MLFATSTTTRPYVWFALQCADSLTLAEAAVNLPVKVVVLRTKSDDDDATNHALTGQTLLLRRVTNDVFLRACAINKGKK